MMHSTTTTTMMTTMMRTLLSTTHERGCPTSETRQHRFQCRFPYRFRFLLMVVVISTVLVVPWSCTPRRVSGFHSPPSPHQRVLFRVWSQPRPRSRSVALFVQTEPPATARGSELELELQLQEHTNDENDTDKDKDNDINNELERNVILAIQNVASSASNITHNPQHFFSNLGEFGKASGALIGQQWLTPEALEDCVLFWDDGYRALMRDLFRSYIFSRESTRYHFQDWVALGWFLLLATSSSLIFFPLLLPLIHVALHDLGGENGIGIDESSYVPPSFRNPRLAAMRRLRRPQEQPLSNYLTNGTPRNIQEGIAFFKDGTLLLARDLQRGTLTSRADDTWSSYGWFVFLAFSSFPLTPLLLPLIDKRRNDGAATSDYVPSAYRPQRLQALARWRQREAVKFGTTPLDTLRAVARAVASKQDEPRDRDRATDRVRPPPPALLLGAIVQAQRDGISHDKSIFLEHLAGVPGRRWELAYVAGKPALMAMRRQLAKVDADGRSGNESWYRPLERLVLPWTRLRDGLYIDSKLVSAVQRFDVETMQNKNGVFQILGSDFFQTTVEGPFSWDGDCEGRRSIADTGTGTGTDTGMAAKRTTNAAVCAFRPTTATVQIGPWWKIEQDLPADAPFDQTHIRDLPFFKFIHVDDRVAVAMGRSGSVALWTRMNE